MNGFFAFYLGFSTVLFTFLFLIWERKDWVNFFIKGIMLIAAVSGLVLTLNALGFVVKV